MKKHCRIVAAIIAAHILFSLSATALSELDFTPEERFSAIIYAENNLPEDSDTALSALTNLLGRSPEITSVFNKAFLGFAAKLTENEVDLVNSTSLFNAYISGSYESLDFEESIQLDEMIYTAADMLSVPESNTESTYTGRGIAVAVIDNGFDVSHSAFSHDISSPKITAETYSDPNISGALNTATTNSLYVSEKLPFVYNYTSGSTDVFTLSNHGTHVAAAIGGHDDIITGIAPDAQLLLMKVFDENYGTASEIFVMQALEDAITLGANVINMSIGTYSGFSEDGMTLMGRIARNLEKSGISVVCAAGNDATLGSKSYYNRKFGINMPLSEHSDYGTLSYPATMTDYIAVASANNLKIAYNALIHIENGELTRINYTDTNSALGIIKTSFFSHFNGKTLEYVIVPGVGKPEDFAGLDLSNKIALIERGEITFAEKTTNENSSVKLVGIELHLPAGAAVPDEKLNGNEVFSKANETADYVVYKLIPMSVAELKYIPKMSITLDSQLMFNVYIPVANTQKFVYDGVEYADLEAIADKKVALDGNEYYLWDGVHPHFGGAKLIADEWLKAFEKNFK